MKRWWRTVRHWPHTGGVVIVLIAFTILVAAIVFSVAVDGDRTRACHDAGGTLVGSTCYAPGIVIEPGR